MSAMQLHMRKRWTYTDRGTKLIGITGEEQTVYYLYWSKDTHTKVNTVDCLYWGNNRHTTRVPSIIFTGIMTNIRKKNTVNYLYWDNDRHTKENTVNYLYWDNDRHTKENTVNYLY